MEFWFVPYMDASHARNHNCDANLLHHLRKNETASPKISYRDACIMKLALIRHMNFDIGVYRRYKRAVFQIKIQSIPKSNPIQNPTHRILCNLYNCVHFHTHIHILIYIPLNLPQGVVTPEAEASMVFQHICANPGDVLLFNGYLPHRSDQNNSDKNRRAVFLTYNPASQVRETLNTHTPSIYLFYVSMSYFLFVSTYSVYTYAARAIHVYVSLVLLSPLNYFLIFHSPIPQIPR
jgi:hypothetical protein